MPKRACILLTAAITFAHTPIQAICSYLIIKNNSPYNINIFTKNNWKTGGDNLTSNSKKKYESNPSPFMTASNKNLWTFGVQLNINRAGQNDGPKACDNVCGHIQVNLKTNKVTTDKKHADLGTCANAQSPWWSNGVLINKNKCTITLTNPNIYTNISCSCPEGQPTPCPHYSSTKKVLPG